ncbi:unnamed protein product, partial [Leptidea sinapis]
MAFNPFLSMNEPVAPISADVLNPFMVTDENPDFTSNENPFSNSNPFSDFGNSYEPPMGDTVPVDIFNSSEPVNVGAKQYNEVNSSHIIFDNQFTSSEILSKPNELNLVSSPMTGDSNLDHEISMSNNSRPLPTETQNLILSVTGHMEFTSSHLLDRIPPTRTPSPVSVRDIQSPSPIPEPDNISTDETYAPSNPEPTRSKPTRPPPARPPRPAPPPRPQPPPQQTQTIDDINLFDAPVPVIVKPTKEAILSLYLTPKPEEKPVDFLSDDIPDITSNVVMSGSNGSNEVETNPLYMDETSDRVDNNTMNINDDIPKENNSILSMDSSEPSMNSNIANVSSSFSTQIESDTSIIKRSQDLEKNPFECADDLNDSSGFETSAVNNIFAIDSEESKKPVLPNSLQTNNTIKIDTNIIDNKRDSPMDVELDSCDNSQIAAEYISYNQAETPTLQTENDTKFGWGAEPMTQDYHTESQNIFSLPNNAFPESYNAIPVSQDAFPESDVEIPETQENNSKTDDYFQESQEAFPDSQDAFDAFSAKFDSANTNQMASDAWGVGSAPDAAASGFEAEAFDSFLQMEAPPPPAATPQLEHRSSRDSTDDTFSVFISREGRDGGDTPPTPLFDEDVSVPLEDFPRTTYNGPGWEMHLRQPNKKKITGQRFWKKVFVRLVTTGDTAAVQLLNSAGDKQPLQELPLQACYSVSDVGAQQFDQFGKIFTVKLQYVFYKERPGVRPGQVTKAERITNKLSQFAAYAIQGDYQGVKEFGSDLRKLGLPVEHAPQVSQLFKIGSLNYEDVKQFSCCVEEALFRLSAHRDRALTYKMEEVQITAVDELYVEQDAEGIVLKQIARVRLFFIGFLSGMPDVELGVNDLRRQGREVVGRHDIIPVATEEWIRVEDPEFHACVQPAEFAATQIIKFKPPDACYIELMRFRVRPPKNRELPLQLKAVWCVIGSKVELRADVLVPGFASRALGQVPCEDVAIRFPIPECWIYLFRVEKHFRYGSVKSAHSSAMKFKTINFLKRQVTVGKISFYVIFELNYILTSKDNLFINVHLFNNCSANIKYIKKN